MRFGRMAVFCLMVATGHGLAGSQLQAECVGQNLLATLPSQDRAALEADVAAHPFARGNLWRAERPGSTVHVVGTLHLYDSRMEPMLAVIGPLVDAADLVMVEAGRDELQQLIKATSTQPELLYRTQGPTLPEALGKADWATLSRELSARGIPPFLASKFQPWYVSMLLGLPACAMTGVTGAGATGLDELVMQRADAAGVPILALEPFDTVFRVFADLTLDQQLDMVRASLAMALGAEDLFATMADAYFAGDHRLIWEFGRMQSLDLPGMDPARLAADFQLLEDTLLTGRNLNWMDGLLAGADGRTAVVAVGAAHLSGDRGLLNLLRQAGYNLTELPL